MILVFAIVAIGKPAISRRDRVCDQGPSKVVDPARGSIIQCVFALEYSSRALGAMRIGGSEGKEPWNRALSLGAQMTKPYRAMKHKRNYLMDVSDTKKTKGCLNNALRSERVAPGGRHRAHPPLKACLNSSRIFQTPVSLSCSERNMTVVHMQSNT